MKLSSLKVKASTNIDVVIDIGGLKFSLEFKNKQDVYTSTRNNFGKDVEDEVDMINDDTSSLVGGGLDSKPKKTNELSTGHVNNGDTLAKDRSWESDGSYASTFHAQGYKKENLNFELDHVSPYMDDVEHVNDHCTS
ncbi:hypothetical protein Tco_0948427 [Tanacetum coccineum]